MKKYFECGKEIINILRNHGYQAFFVGGFVRDYLLNIEANDIDITTNAKPEEIEKLFSETKATGKRYGTISVFIDKYSFEVTTYRADIEYIDFRHPERIVFSETIEEDLKRRDFTINAFAMDEKSEIIDLFNGKKDLEKKLIRAIDDPDVRFNEDALRMLRAFRFVSKLGFDIEEKTYKSIRKNIGLLKNISSERVISEFKEIFKYKYYLKAINLLDGINIEKAFPELSEGISKLSDKSNVLLDLVDFFTVCFYMYGKEIPSYWRFSNKDLKRMNDLKCIIDKTENGYDKFVVFEYGKDLCIKANHIAYILGKQILQKEKIAEIKKNLPILNATELDISGNDILKLIDGLDKKIIGEILDKILKTVLNGELENNREEIEKFTLKLLENYYER